MEKKFELNSKQLQRLHSFCISVCKDDLTANKLLSKLIKIEARANSQQNEAVTATVDYTNFDISFSQPVDSDIVLDVFINRVAYEILENEMENDSFYFNDSIMTAMVITTEDPEDPDKTIDNLVAVHYFKNDDEMKSTAIAKSLRVNTQYGIGYVGLVRENDPCATEMKICLGKDSYGNPVIRSFERVIIDEHNKIFENTY